MSTLILTGGTGYSEPTGTWGGTLGGERFTNTGPATVAFAFTGLTAGTAYVLGLDYNDDTNRVTNAGWSVAGTAGTPSGTIDVRNPVTDFAGPGTSRRFLPQTFTPTGTTLTLTISYPSVPAPAVGDYVGVVAGYLDLGDPIPTVQAGDWGSGSTWRLGAVPAAPSTVAIGHAVTVTTAQTIGAQGAAGTAAITISRPGNLTITGATLTVRGDLIGPGYNAGTLTTDLTLGAGGGIEFDPGVSGGRYKFFLGTDSAWATSGTTIGSRAFVRTKSGSPAGTFASLYSDGSSRTGLASASHVDFARLGDSGQDALQVVNDGGGTFSLSDFTLDTCGRANVQAPSGTAIASLAGGAWTNSTGTVSLFFSGTGALSGGGIRLIDSCRFDQPIEPNGPAAWTISNCYLDNGWANLGGSGLWAAFDRNFARLTGTIASNTGFGIAGPVTNSVIYFDAPTLANPHYLDIPTNITGTCAITNNVWYFNGTDAQGNLVIQGADTAAACAFTFSGNICLPNAAGDASGEAVSLSSQGWANSTWTVVHNTHFAGNGYFLEIGEGQTSADSRWASARSNLIVDYPAGSPTAAKALNAAGTALVDVIAPANADYNGGWNLKATTTNPNFTNQGAGYWAAWSVTPGAHDVAADPRFVDRAHATLAAWDLSLGGAGTEASARTKLQSGTAGYTAPAFRTYLAGKLAPTNAAYHNTAHDGTDIGAVPYQLAASFLAAWATSSPNRTLGCGIY